MDYESLSAMGTMLGSGAVIVASSATCMVKMLEVILRFYHHESCGQCTPCREGTGWIHSIVKNIVLGAGKRGDLDLILSICDNMAGRTICALSDAAAMPARSFIRKFRDEFDYFITRGKSMDTPVSHFSRGL